MIGRIAPSAAGIILALIWFLGAAGTASGHPEGPSGQSLTVTDLAGREVAVPREINNIACLDVLCYQKLFMLGQSAKAVVMYFTDAPWMAITNPDMAKIPKIEGNPSLEELLLSKVDVAFFAYDTRRMAGKLASVGIPGVVSQPQGLRADTLGGFLDQTKRSVMVYGQVLGGEALERAKDWCDYLDERVRYVSSRTARIPENQRPKVYYLRGPTALHTQGRNGDTFWYGELAGADMLAKNYRLAAMGPVSMEQIIEWNPDVILVGRQYPLDMVLKDPRWRTISAVKSAKVYPLPSGVFYWDGGLEEVLLMQYLAKTLHPDLFADLDLVAEVRSFYSRFYRYPLSEDQARNLLAGLSPDGSRFKLYNN
jgi:iron complex transport system substrate-binding protein